MNQSLDSSTLLRHAAKNTDNRQVGLPVTRLSGLLAHATISPAKGSTETIINSKDRYYIGLLEELFLELKFYYHQSKTNLSAEIRLERVLKGLAQTMNKSGPNCIEIFLKSIAKELECAWFLISTFNNYSKVKPDFFRDKLFEYIKNSNQLNKLFKVALIRSKAGSLRNELQDVYTFSTLATKLEILDILAERQEIDTSWLTSLQTAANPSLDQKINTLLNLTAKIRNLSIHEPKNL